LPKEKYEKAMKLVKNGDIINFAHESEPFSVSAFVISGKNQYMTVISEDGYKCSCKWNNVSKGICKHIGALALESKLNGIRHPTIDKVIEEMENNGG